MKFKTAIMALSAALALGSVSPAPVPAQELKKITHGYIAVPGYFWDVFEAQALGFFKAEGLDVESTRSTLLNKRSPPLSPERSISAARPRMSPCWQPLKARAILL